MAPAYVLLVDDNDEIRDLFSEILRRAGFHVLCANDGVYAHEYLVSAAVKPTVILLDIMMPKMDGLALRRLLLEQPDLASIPVVFMSALPESKEMLALTPAAYLQKPVDVSELIEATRALYPR